MPKVSKRQKCIENIASRILGFESLHYGEKPEYIYMTTDLYKVLTGRKTLRYSDEFCDIKVRLFDGDGLKFYLVQKVFEVTQ